MTYDDFKDHVLRMMWREGDTEYLAQLDNIIPMATSHIQRVVRFGDDQIKETPVVVTGLSVDLPSDFIEARSIRSDKFGTLKYVDLDTLNQVLDRHLGMSPNRTATRSVPADESNVFSLVGNTLKLVTKATVDLSTQWNADLIYYAALPDFKTADASFVADKYLDLYTYAVAHHSVVYLRDDPRAPLVASFFKGAVDAVTDEQARNRYPDHALSDALPGHVY